MNFSDKEKTLLIDALCCKISDLWKDMSWKEGEKRRKNIQRDIGNFDALRKKIQSDRLGA